MKHLNWISLFLLLLICCKTQPPPAKTDLPEPFIQKVDKSLIYRASFDYKDYHFSGLCVFKKVEDRNIRVVFLNEMGITFMDFELAPKETIVHKMMEQLDKKIILGFIESDFRQLLMTDLFSPKKLRYKVKNELIEFKAKDNLKVSYYREKNKENISLSVRKGMFGIKGVTVKYKYNKSPVPNEIILTHRRVKMNLKLTLLEKI